VRGQRFVGRGAATLRQEEGEEISDPDKKAADWRGYRAGAMLNK